MAKKGENIYKRKDGRWEARYKKGVSDNGRILYGSCYGKTYREAKEKAEQYRVSAQAPGTVTSDREKRFADYCEEWLFINRNRLKETSFAQYMTVMDTHILPFFGNETLGNLSTESVTRFTNCLISKKLSPPTVKEILVILKSVLKYMSRFDRSLRWIEVYIPKQTQKEIRILTDDEQRRFIQFLSTDMDSHKFGILFGLMTGLRIGEVCALRSRDISLTERTVTVRETMQRIRNLNGDGGKTKIVLSPPKSDTSARVVPLTHTAFELCRERIYLSSPDAFLLTGSEEKFIEPRVLQYRIKKYGKICGIKDLHFHALRHTFATRCVEAGFEIKSLSEVLGHSSPQITLERYVHSSLDFKRQNMSKLEAIGF